MRFGFNAWLCGQQMIPFYKSEFLQSFNCMFSFMTNCIIIDFSFYQHDFSENKDVWFLHKIDFASKSQFY
jgi:hypothetical protein